MNVYELHQVISAIFVVALFLDLAIHVRVCNTENASKRRTCIIVLVEDLVPLLYNKIWSFLLHVRIISCMSSKEEATE